MRVGRYAIAAATRALPDWASYAVPIGVMVASVVLSYVGVQLAI